VCSAGMMDFRSRAIPFLLIVLVLVWAVISKLYDTFVHLLEILTRFSSCRLSLQRKQRMDYRVPSHHTPITHEQGLRRSFSKIHHHGPSFNASLPCTTSVNNHSSDSNCGRGSLEEVHQDTLSRKDRRSKAVRNKRSLPRDRRGSLHAVSPPSPHRAGGAHGLPLQEMPWHPFPKPRLPKPSADQEQVVETHHRGFRKDYALGETIRSRTHMIAEPTARQALQSASSMDQHDFAFVRRSDGSISYAILAYRSVKRIKGAADNTEAYEECMTFVLSRHGSTKVVPKRFWSDFVFQPELEECSFNEHTSSISRENNPPLACQEIEAGDNTWTPPSIISFTPDDEFGDECSLMSSVSDRPSNPQKGRVR